ncbi:MAG: Mrp/NBP35 family ATP-binding protein [Tissierellia bacterium]|nr:Mrp/NBP35 family ATP-binding protein [Tissierellia bacterium]
MAGIQKFKTNEESSIKHIIGIVSGKGGVGKSFVTSTLASELVRQGKKVGILDADITGPSIPSAFGLQEMAYSDGKFILPEVTKTGIKVISVNLILENKEAPVLWRAPIIGQAISQFFSDVKWGALDYLLIDMPPGTGDVSLTVFQSISLDGIIIVSTPQDLVSVIVKKAVNMAKMMNIPILGFVENMSYYKCPCCNHVDHIFGTSNLEEEAKEEKVENTVKFPINSEFTKYVDEGRVEFLEFEEIKEFTQKLVEG